MQSNTAPQNVTAAAQLFARWFHQNYPYLSLTQEVFDVIATTLRSLNVPMESVSADNYRAAFTLAVNQGRISLPPDPASVAHEAEIAERLRQAEAAESERQRQERIAMKEAEFFGRQNASGPGAASAFGTAESRRQSEENTRMEAQKVKDAAILKARHVEFNELVRQARMDASAQQPHSRKQGRWDALYQKIKQRFPEAEFQASL